MGFFDVGDALEWSEVIKILKGIKDDGILQFISLFQAKSSVQFDLKWGDEIEFFLVKLDEDGKSVKLLLNQSIFDELVKDEAESKIEQECDWRPEYGCFMIESVPKKPYPVNGGLSAVQHNMSLRRKMIEAKLGAGEYVFSMTHFPLMGSGDFTSPHFDAHGPVANSKFTPDQVLNNHTRFATLSRNIRIRKGKNVAINVPLFFDKNTKEIDYSSLFPDQDLSTIPVLPNHVYCDSMAFGMGQCCLQVTFQLPSIVDSMSLYDKFIPFAPLFLALTASTPILRGYLVNTDVRWHIIEAAVDDRTEEELKTISKSRYASVSSYLNVDESTANRYNDVPVEIVPEYYDQLLSEGVPKLLAQHIAHLFIRDPLVIYPNKIKLDNSAFSDHFENIQSTNWQSCRFKPPPPGQDAIGWRVEFRTMELNFTDFENAANAVAIRLLMLWLVKNNPTGIIIPISKVDENMNSSLKIDSVLKEKFWFSTNLFCSNAAQTDDDVKLLTLNEIFNGCEGFPGVLSHLREMIKGTEDFELLNKYLNFIGGRANGSIRTNANWIREYVRNHPDYEHDSIVKNSIVFDMMKEINQIAHGKTDVKPSPFGDFVI